MNSSSDPRPSDPPAAPPGDPPPSPAPEAPIDLPIDGVLDLHTFRPQDVKPLVYDYLALCQERGILEVRIIHGKGAGVLRATVHALLKRHSEVESFAQASELFGGWGATIAHLRPRGDRSAAKALPDHRPDRRHPGQG